jgi:translation elongation factor EF-4
MSIRRPTPSSFRWTRRARSVLRGSEQEAELRAAAEGLGGIGLVTAEIISALDVAAGDTVASVRKAATAALERIKWASP